MAENSDQVLHFNEYFKIIRNRLWIIFTIFISTVASGIYVTNYVLAKGYSATAEIQILPSNETFITPVGPGDGGVQQQFDPIDFQAEFEIMQSSKVLMPVITDLQLDKTWAKREKTSLDALPPQDALAILKKNMKLDFSRGSNIIDITILSEESEECADVANAIADRYKAMREVEQEQKDSQGIDALRDQIRQQEKVVDDANTAVENMRTAMGKIDVNVPNGAGASYTDLDQQDLELRKKDLLDAQEEYDARNVLLANVINLPDDKFLDTLNGMGQEPANIASLSSDVLRGETDIANLLKSGLGEDNLEILSRRAEIDAKKQQIADLVAGLRSAMTVQTNVSKSRVALLQEQVDQLKERVRTTTTNQLVPFRDAQLKLERQQTLLDALNVRLQQTIVDSQLKQSPVQIISRADPPENPSKPNKNLNYAVSILAGLFVGIGVAFLIEYLDTSVKTMADAETLLGLPVLTVIPNKGGPMQLIQDAGRLPHAEGYRILRAKLDLKVQNGMGPSLTMLSGGPGEGKTTTTLNLAIVCAQAGQSVILVDCDLRRPALHELLGVSNERGLSNYLRGEGEAVSFIQRTAIPKLQVLTAGNMPMADIGVLAGDKIRVLLDDLKQRYDLVLVDAPPVLGISDGSIIAREVDYVILVIQHRRYPREISLRGKRAIEEVHGNCVGMVLNCVEVKSDDSYFYYSNYGNYYRKKTKADRNKKRQDIARANGKPVVVATRKPELESDEF